MALLFGEIRNLIKKINKVSNGQARIVEIGETMNIIEIEISPNDGLYKGASFLFKIRVDPYQVKSEAPTVICLTPVYHPNIDTSDLQDIQDDDDDELNSNVCLNMLDDWQPSYGLDGLVNGLLFFFYHPEIEDPLSPYISPGMSAEEFSENVHRSLLGEEVDGFPFERNLCDTEYEILKKKLGNVSEMLIENLDPVLPKPESSKESTLKDSDAIVLPNIGNEVAVVPNTVSETVVSTRDSETTDEANTDSETTVEPNRNNERTDTTFESASENKSLLPSEAASAKTMTFHRFHVPENNFCSIKSFDKSVPESDIIHAMVDRFLRRFFCCHSNLPND